MAQELRAGGPNALTKVCDAYAARLYDYCHALMRDQESATQTLHDSLLSAQAHVGRLRDPQLFRGWLYALVRSQCLRRLADPNRPTGGHEAPEIDEQIFDPAARARREETRQLVHSALAGLNGKQREAIDLVLRHHLAPEELAGVLGLSTEQATELAWQARERLDDAFAAAILVRSRRSECPSVAALVDPQEWPLSPVTSRKLVRHLESCPVCAEQRRAKASTAELLEVLEVLPVALLPADLQHRVLATATDPALAAHRDAIAQAAEPLDEWGWPAVAEPPARRGGGRGARERDGDGSPRIWPAIAAAVCVLLIVGGVYLILPTSSSSKPSAASSTAALPSDTALVSPDPSESVTESATPSPTTSTRSPSPTPTPTRRTPTPRATTKKPKPTPKTSAPVPATGTLSVGGGCSIPADGPPNCSFSVTAVGGNVNSWSASASSPLVASGGGRILKGGTGTVSVTRTGPCTASGSGTVTVSNGGGPVTVTWEC
ncbi:sigma-70 family RNA polymerase sigma factor [Actinomadura scrupuli]|uniref:sigma-70 family RNA polymerase sigma factor n=1 Tax=Actinomadura scrupuli TaxID=559629 RepID=UPI003D958C7D